MANEFELRYKYAGDTKGTWKYAVALEKDQRVSGPTTVYLLKTDYPKKPCEEVIGTFKLVDPNA